MKAEDLLKHFSKQAGEDVNRNGNLNRAPLLEAMKSFGVTVTNQHIDYWQRSGGVPLLTQIAASLASGRTIHTDVSWFEQGMKVIERKSRKNAK